MLSSAPTLRRLLREARRVGLQRAAGLFLADGAALAGCALLAAIAVTAGTARGDLVSRALLLALCAGWAALAVAHGRRALARFGRGADAWIRTARTIARTPGPLRQAWADPPLERRLRQEVLGAVELALAPPAGAEDLAASYVADLDARLARIDPLPGLAVPRLRLERRRWVFGVLLAAGLLASGSPALTRGASLVLRGEDGRPPPPPRPLWSALTVTLEFPPHTGRTPRTIPNPSGPVRAPAGTTLRLEFEPILPATAAAVVVTADAREAASTPPPQTQPLAPVEGDDARGAWGGSFEVRAGGSWTALLFDEDEVIGRSAPMPVVLEPDRPPEIELFPLPPDTRDVTDLDRVTLRFRARDDFGLLGATLVYRVGDDDERRLPIATPEPGMRAWNGRYVWDLSGVPVGERGEVSYFVEVRDTDPGLGLEPLPDPPGKVARSAVMQLRVRDEEAEHAANLTSLRDARDAAVDLLALRLLAPLAPGSEVGPPVEAARRIFSADEDLLRRLAALVDALSVDAMVRPRQVEELAAIHGRLRKLHRREATIHEDLPPGLSHLDPDAARGPLQRLVAHNRRATPALEDEIIRLDDLVDGQILERIEALLARLRATQTRIVDLLERLQAGDDSVRPMLQQLMERRREDLRKIAEARAMLAREVGDDFINQDALELLSRMEDEQATGQTEDQLERARAELEELQGMHEALQDRLQRPESGGQALSPEDRARMELLRELSRLQDEQRALGEPTREAEQAYREAVRGMTADPKTRRRVERAARELTRKLDGVRDARLGRKAREALEDAKDAAQRLQRAVKRPEAKALEMKDAATALRRALQTARLGARAGEAEARQLERAASRARALEREIDARLPPPNGALDEAVRQRLEQEARSQRALSERARRLLRGRTADPLPDPGKDALEQAIAGMERAAEGMERVTPSPARERQQAVGDALQRAIDSLRRSSPPPPAGAAGPVSTETERDRSLRDLVMDAMKDGTVRGYEEPVRRYYEELLR